MSTWAALRRHRITVAVAAAAGAIVLAAGCGGDDEDGTETAAGPNEKPPTRTVTAPSSTTTEEKGTSTDKGESKEPSKGGGGGSPEDQPGGAGDEEPVRSEVVLTGKGGRIGPVLVKVPPFVSIHVVLRSSDGKPYVVAFGKQILRVGPKGADNSATFDGLRPGKRLNGAAVSGKVVIEASAEPGP